MPLWRPISWPMRSSPCRRTYPRFRAGRRLYRLGYHRHTGRGCPVGPGSLRFYRRDPAGAGRLALYGLPSYGRTFKTGGDGLCRVFFFIPAGRPPSRRWRTGTDHRTGCGPHPAFAADAGGRDPFPVRRGGDRLFLGSPRPYCSVSCHTPTALEPDTARHPVPGASKGRENGLDPAKSGRARGRGNRSVVTARSIVRLKPGEGEKKRGGGSGSPPRRPGNADGGGFRWYRPCPSQKLPRGWPGNPPWSSMRGGGRPLVSWSDGTAAASPSWLGRREALKRRGHMAAPERGGSRHPRQTHPALRDGSSGRPVGHHASDREISNKSTFLFSPSLSAFHALDGPFPLAIQIPKRPGGLNPLAWNSYVSRANLSSTVAGLLYGG